VIHHKSREGGFLHAKGKGSAQTGVGDEAKRSYPRVEKRKILYAASVASSL
jgi:hypothetical protein